MRSLKWQTDILIHHIPFASPIVIVWERNHLRKSFRNTVKLGELSAQSNKTIICLIARSSIEKDGRHYRAETLLHGPINMIPITQVRVYPSGH